MEKWPNFFIVGAPKAGTTSIYEYLKNHPQIFMSPIKEPNYFAINILTQNDPINPIRNKKKYLELFKDVKNELVIGEASTHYLSDHDAPKSIHDITPTARILISLRDPVEREFSHFLMHQGYGETIRNFHEQLKIEIENYQTSTEYFALKHGMYYENVKRYVDIFGNNQVKIIIFEEFIKNPKEGIEEILRFLDLDPKLAIFKNKIHNPYKIVRGPIAHRVLESKKLSKLAKSFMSESIRVSIKEKFFLKRQKKPELESKDRTTLIKFYQEDVKKLESVIGRRLQWRNFEK